MGGYGGYDPPPRRSDAQIICDEMRSIFSASNEKAKQAALDTTLKKYQERSPREGFLDLLRQASPHEFTYGLVGVEIELKLNMDAELVGQRKAAQVLQESPAPPVDKFIRNKNIRSGFADHVYFGTRDEERFVVMTNDSGTYLKRKGPAKAPYMFGFTHEEFVLRRTELQEKVSIETENTSLVELLESLVTLCEPTPVQRRPGFTKHRVVQTFMQRHTGREYTLVFAECTQEGRDDKLFQLEIEYIGYIPGIAVSSEGIESERHIVKDILQLADVYREQGFTLTRQTKFDWAQGNVAAEKEEGIDVVESVQEPSQSVTGQSFFGDGI